MTLLAKISVLSLLISAFLLSGCQKTEPQSTEKVTSAEENTAVKTLSIGFQKSSLNLLVARQQQLLEQAFPNAKIEWREFPAGPQMLEALAVGAIDFGYVGNTPLIFAQAAAKPLS
ncbi:MAG: aliphatic sulfonates ABC transporter substrate-binding protein, partial [Pseudomonadota bacterium]|nr:aliphatic sulfonates ABC transporter substrate-binding protein [Pseudomonadota bacterium]